MMPLKRHPALLRPDEGPLPPHFPIEIFFPCRSEKLDKGALLIYEINNGCGKDARSGGTRRHAFCGAIMAVLKRFFRGNHMQGAEVFRNGLRKKSLSDIPNALNPLEAAVQVG